MSARTWIRDVVLPLFGLVRRGRIEHRLDDEMRFHLDMLTEKHVRAGSSQSEARRRALAEFGGTERFKDEARDEYRARRVDEASRDIRYALRVLRRHPGFAVAAGLTFALGIGASTAIYSMVHGVLLRPLPYADPNRLVVVWERNEALGNDRNVVSVPNFEAWRARARSFMGMAALVPSPATISRAPSAERVMGAEVSPGYFELLGVAPALGRAFTREDEQEGRANVLVLSDGFWRSHFGADPAVLGQSLTLDGHSHTIIGVMPRDFEPPQFSWLIDQAFWRPFAATASNRGWGRFLLVVARLKPDISLASARSEMQAIAAQRASEDGMNTGWSTTIVTLSDQITGDVRLPLLVLLGAVGLLLLMAVTNVANLTFGLVRRRAHELAVRRAIGATSSRILRQLVTQSVVVGAIGCGLGVLAALGGVRALRAFMPPETPRIGSIRMDSSVLFVTVTVSAIAAVAIGAIAALRCGRGDLSSMRESGGRVASRARGGSLVTAEIALGLVLTVLGGLTLRTFAALRSVDLGFDAQHVVIARVGLSGPRYQTPAARWRFFDQLLARVRTIPGVRAAGTISTRPFGGMGPATTLGDASMPTSGDSVLADVRYADGSVFQALRVPLVAGTLFDSRDDLGAAPRAIVNQTLARRLWPARNPIGQRLRVPMFNGIQPEVIGVVGDMHLMDARTPPRGTVYLSNAWLAGEVLDLIVRANSDASLVAALRSAVTALDPSVPVYQVTPMDALVTRALARDRFTAVLLGTFAVVSLLLAAVGIYGVFAADVAQRRKEIGIRVALGAPSGGVIALVMRRAVTRALLGIALGIVGAWLAARAMESLLFGVRATDPVSFVGVAFVLLVVALAATLIPALRAARVSPLVAIRID